MNVIFTGIYDTFRNTDSSYTTIHAYNVDDLTNPVLIDSTSRLRNTRFSKLFQYDNYIFGVADYMQYADHEPGLYIIEWDDNFQSELIDRHTEYSYCTDIVLGDDFAYVTTFIDGVFLVDITDKTNPQVLGQVESLPPSSAQMTISEDTLYVLTGLTFRKYHISYPLNPEQISIFELPYAHVGINFQLYQRYAFVCFDQGLPNGPGGFMSIDITDPTNSFIGYDRLNITDGPKPLVLNYPLLFLPSASDEWLISIYNVSDPINPCRVVEIDDLTYNPMSVVSRDNYLYTFGGFEQIYDLTDPAHPLLISETPYEYGGESYLFGDKLYTRDWVCGIRVWDPARSPLVRQDVGVFTCVTFSDIAFDSEYIYLPAHERGFIILRLDVPTGIPEEETELPENISVLIAYPNPSNTTVKFNINLPVSNNGEFWIYDITGRLVKTIEAKSAFSIEWNGIDLNGEKVCSGIYFGKYSNDQISETLKVVLLK